MNDACRHQRTSPGDMFPPLCTEPAGHTGPHRSKVQFGSDHKVERETWANEEPLTMGRSMFDEGAA